MTSRHTGLIVDGSVITVTEEFDDIEDRSRAVAEVALDAVKAMFESKGYPISLGAFSEGAYLSEAYKAKIIELGKKGYIHAFIAYGVPYGSVGAASLAEWLAFAEKLKGVGVITMYVTFQSDQIEAPWKESICAASTGMESTLRKGPLRNLMAGLTGKTAEITTHLLENCDVNQIREHVLGLLRAHFFSTRSFSPVPDTRVIRCTSTDCTLTHNALGSMYFTDMIFGGRGSGQRDDPCTSHYLRHRLEMIDLHKRSQLTLNEIHMALYGCPWVPDCP